MFGFGVGEAEMCGGACGGTYNMASVSSVRTQQPQFVFIVSNVPSATRTELHSASFTHSHKPRLVTGPEVLPGQVVCISGLPGTAGKLHCIAAGQQ